MCFEDLCQDLCFEFRALNRVCSDIVYIFLDQCARSFLNALVPSLCMRNLVLRIGFQNQVRMHR